MRRKMTGLPSARARSIRSASRRPRSVAAGSPACAHAPAGQQGRRLDQDQVGAGALQHERRVVRQQLLGGGVRGQCGAARVGQHARHDQPVAHVLVVGPGRRGPGQAGHRVAGQEPVTGRPGARVLQDLGPAGLVLGAEAAVHGARRRPHRAAFPPHFVQVLGQPRAADPRALGRRHDGLAQLQGGGALHRHAAAIRPWPAAGACRAAPGPAGPARRPALSRSRWWRDRWPRPVPASSRLVQVRGVHGQGQIGLLVVLGHGLGWSPQPSRASQSVMIRPMRGPAWPSHSGGNSPVYGPSSHAFSTAEASSADVMSLLLPW